MDKNWSRSGPQKTCSLWITGTFHSALGSGAEGSKIHGLMATPTLNILPLKTWWWEVKKLFAENLWLVKVCSEVEKWFFRDRTIEVLIILSTNLMSICVLVSIFICQDHLVYLCLSNWFEKEGKRRGPLIWILKLSKKSHISNFDFFNGIGESQKLYCWKNWAWIIHNVSSRADCGRRGPRGGWMKNVFSSAILRPHSKARKSRVANYLFTMDVICPVKNEISVWETD